jgi:hypothetical protein
LLFFHEILFSINLYIIVTAIAAKSAFLANWASVPPVDKIADAGDKWINYIYF